MAHEEQQLSARRQEHTASYTQDFRTLSEQGTKSMSSLRRQDRAVPLSAIHPAPEHDTGMQSHSLFFLA